MIHRDATVNSLWGIHNTWSQCK